MWTCENCGQSNSDNSSACSNCGKEYLPSALPKTINEAQQFHMVSKRSPIVPILLSVILVAAVAVVWMFNKGILLVNFHDHEESTHNSQEEASPIGTSSVNDEDFASAQALAREYGAKRFLAAGSEFTVGIKPDGSCIATGRYYPDVSNWSDMIALTANLNTVAGLRADGTVLCSNYSIDVSDWERITQIDFFAEVFEDNQHIVGLTAEGTVVSSGTNHFGECDVDEWSDIVDVAAGSSHTVGLRGDGTVIACGNNMYGQCDVSEWRRIVDVDASRYATYGLTADGNVLVAGFYENDHDSYVPDVPEWDNVVAIIASNETGNANDFVVGICRDGTIVSNRRGYLDPGDIESFSDVQAVAVASWGYTVCLDSQGHVRDVGWDVDGTRQTNSWPLLMTN